MMRGMSNAEILEQYARGAEDVHPDAWQALQSEVRRRQLRIKPWKDQSHILLTTAERVDGFRVTRTLDIISAECAFGMNVLRDLFANVTDLAGGRSKSTQTALRQARKTCLAELRREAASIDADAVIAVDLDYSEFSGQGKSMLFLVATGTAVQLERELR